MHPPSNITSVGQCYFVLGVGHVSLYGILCLFRFCGESSLPVVGLVMVRVGGGVFGKWCSVIQVFWLEGESCNQVRIFIGFSICHTRVYWYKIISRISTILRIVLK